MEKTLQDLIMRIILKYYNFFEEVTGFKNPPKRVVFINRRFLAFLLLYYSSNDRKILGFVKKINLLVLRIFFAIESSKYLIVKGCVFFPHPRNIIIGASSIGENVVIYQNVTIGAKRIDYTFNRDNRPKIEDNCVICTGAVVIGGGVLEKGSIVIANSLRVLKNS